MFPHSDLQRNFSDARGHARPLHPADGEITEHFAETHGVLAVAAFGSNAERERFDDFSDLDFLVLVQPEAKTRVLEQSGRLEAIHPVDGIGSHTATRCSCSFRTGYFATSAWWRRTSSRTSPTVRDISLEARRLGRDRPCASEPERPVRDELTADALFHLYTGFFVLCAGRKRPRLKNQVAAAQRVFTLLQAESADAFSSLRRAERILDRDLLAAVMPGYGHSREAAGALLSHCLSRRTRRFIKQFLRFSIDRRDGWRYAYINV
jgi:predicted nucleotidyltransferase